MLHHVEEAWDVLTKDGCVPVHVALQLMDNSSLGRGNDYQDFQRTSHQLQKALKAIVNGMCKLETSGQAQIIFHRAPSGF